MASQVDFCSIKINHFFGGGYRFLHFFLEKPDFFNQRKNNSNGTQTFKFVHIFYEFVQPPKVAGRSVRHVVRPGTSVRPPIGGMHRIFSIHTEWQQ